MEATAYGTRMIIEQFENAGVPVNALVLSGGIPAKNKMLVQVYADVCNKEIRISEQIRQALSVLQINLVSLLHPERDYRLKMQTEAAENLGKSPRCSIQTKSGTPAAADRHDKPYQGITRHYTSTSGSGENDVNEEGPNKIRRRPRSSE
ncbi:MAG: FGGY-family carbohydrate kinase [Anaerobutyricum soehngenii]